MKRTPLPPAMLPVRPRAWTAACVGGHGNPDPAIFMCDMIHNVNIYNCAVRP